MPVFESKHPLVKHKLSLLRKVDTSSKEFREVVGELGSLLTYEATLDLPLANASVETWQGPVDTPFVLGKKLTLVPILRAGLGLLDGVLHVIPNARVSVVGIKRNEESLEAEQYYENLAPRVKDRMALILDPMLATGGTLLKTISGLKKAGCTDIRVLTLIAAPEGIAACEKAHPDVRVYVGNIDSHLNEKGYIIPGLGDAGDRLFGTQQKGNTSSYNIE